jgi:hypothetical protein
MTERTISEKELQKVVIKHAKERGWRTAHFGNSVKIVRRKDGYKTIPDKNATGFPDLIIVRPPRVMAIELKGKSGILTDEQMRWLEDLDDCNIEVAIWRPNDWDSGTIQRRLK